LYPESPAIANNSILTDNAKNGQAGHPSEAFWWTPSLSGCSMIFRVQATQNIVTFPLHIQYTLLL